MLNPQNVETVTPTTPLPTGDATVQEVAEQSAGGAAVAPNDTLPPVKFFPVIVITVPPLAGPVAGASLVIEGGGWVFEVA